MTEWEESIGKAMGFLKESLTADSTTRHSLLFDAAEIYTEMLENGYNDTDRAILYVSRAFSYTQRGLISKAKNDLEKAVKCDPDVPMAHSDLGYTYFTLGQNTKAKTAYLTALVLLEEIGVEDMEEEDFITAIRTERALDHLGAVVEGEFEFYALSRGIVTQSRLDNMFGEKEDDAHEKLMVQ